MALPEWCVRSLRARTKGMGILMVVLVAVSSVAAYGQFATKPVVLIVDGEEQIIETTAKTVGDVLAERGFYVRSRDLLLPEEDAALESGMEIHLQRAFPVFLRVDGQARLVYSAGLTTAEVLEEAGVRLALEDRVEPALSAKPEQGGEIVVTRVGTEIVSEEMAIPYRTETRSDNAIPRGRRKVVTEGKPGTFVRTYKVTYANGEEERRELIEEKQKAAPVHAVIVVGTLVEEQVITASRGGRVAGEVIEGIASWYGDKFHGRRTAYGYIYDKNKLTAAYPSRAMRGRTLRVTYLKTGRSVNVVVNDYGPHIAGRVIDLSRAAAGAIGLISDGVGRVRIEVLE